MLSSTTNIKVAIEYLHWIQSNLDMIQGLPNGAINSTVVALPVGDFTFSTLYGLCDNILEQVLDSYDVEEMFEAWSDNAGALYPCGDRIDFLNDRNLYRNPKRIELIKHCIKYMQDVLEKRDAQED